jgi:hypothetical protein
MHLQMTLTRAKLEQLTAHLVPRCQQPGAEQADSGSDEKIDGD